MSHDDWVERCLDEPVQRLVVCPCGAPVVPTEPCSVCGALVFGRVGFFRSHKKPAHNGQNEGKSCAAQSS